MSKSLSFTVMIYSPRWGHEDPYKFTFTIDKISIDGPKKVECKQIKNSDPEWSGYGTSNSLVEALENDAIYPPSVFVNAIEWAWSDWRDEIIDSTQLEKEMRGLCDWLDNTARNKPSTKFWQQKF